MISVREDGEVIKKSIYRALGINLEGCKELLGLRIDQSEGAKFWHRILNELKNRGLHDVLIAAVDWLAGFPEAFVVSSPMINCQSGKFKSALTLGGIPEDRSPIMHRAYGPQFAEVRAHPY